MKKTMTIVFLLFIFLLPAFAIDIFVGGEKVPMDVPAQIIEGRTMLPIAAIGKSLNASSQWDGESRTVSITRGSDNILLQIGNTQALVNGNVTPMDVPAQIVDGRTMVPVSFIAKAFGENVRWDESSRSVDIGKYRVTRVIDGDTIEIKYKGKAESVRLIGIDAPESVHPDPEKNVPFGKVSSEFTRQALQNKEVDLEFDVSDRDAYGRLLAYVWLDGNLFNRSLIESGMAVVSTYPPDIKYSADFVKEQERARTNKLGLWAEEVKVAEAPPEVAAGQSEKLIKGNQRSMIYHMPDGRDYDKVADHNVIWFANEEDAQAAGFRRAKQ